MGKNSKLVEIKIKIIYSLNNGKYYNKDTPPLTMFAKD